MEVNAGKIKMIRTTNGWTQQHLADACGISLRTVQRVERYGNASQETLASLASVYELTQGDLLTEQDDSEKMEGNNIVVINVQTKAVVLAALVGMCVGALFMFLINN
jgi:transcriptional regulator with XRE-family HTH domain